MGDGHEVAERMRMSAKFFPVRDPHREMLILGSATILGLLSRESGYTAEGVAKWLREHGVNLTVRMRGILGLEGPTLPLVKPTGRRSGASRGENRGRKRASK